MFSRRFKELREARGDSQATIAERCGVSQKTVSRWETGEQIPRGDELCAVAEVYAVTTDYLLGRSEHPMYYSHPVDGGEILSESKEPPSKEVMQQFEWYKSGESVPRESYTVRPDELEPLIRRLVAEAVQNQNTTV